MGKFTNRMRRSMYGRYGSDTLGTVVMTVCAGIVLLHTVLSLFGVGSPFFDLLVFLIAGSLVIWTICRMLSRKIDKRRAENQKFCAFFRLRKSKFRDRKTHVYRKCPSCRATLRLPKAKGKHSVVCPRCKNRFQVKG